MRTRLGAGPGDKTPCGAGDPSMTRAHLRGGELSGGGVAHLAGAGVDGERGGDGGGSAGGGGGRRGGGRRGGAAQARHGKRGRGGGRGAGAGRGPGGLAMPSALRLCPTPLCLQAAGRAVSFPVSSSTKHQAPMLVRGLGHPLSAPWGCAEPAQTCHCGPHRVATG